jgi:hypothetical protein
MTTYYPTTWDDVGVDRVERYYGPPQSILQEAFDAESPTPDDCTPNEHRILRFNLYYPQESVAGPMPEGGWPLVLYSSLAGYWRGDKEKDLDDDGTITSTKASCRFAHACLEKGIAIAWANLPVTRGENSAPGDWNDKESVAWDPVERLWGDKYRGNGVMPIATSNDDGTADDWPGPKPEGYHLNRPHPWLDPLWLNCSKAAMWLVQYCRYNAINGDGDLNKRLNINPNRIGSFGYSAAGTSFAWPAYQPNRAGSTGMGNEGMGAMDTRLNAAAFQGSTAYWLAFGDTAIGRLFPQIPGGEEPFDYDKCAETMGEVDVNTRRYLGADWFGGMGGEGFGGDLGDPGIYQQNKSFPAWWYGDFPMSTAQLDEADRYIQDPTVKIEQELGSQHSVYKAYRVKARLPSSTRMIVGASTKPETVPEAAVDPDPESGGGVAADKEIFTGIAAVYDDAISFLKNALYIAPTPPPTPTFSVKLSENFSNEAFPSAPQSKLTPSEWARNLIYERTTRVNNIPMFYREALRFMISKLGTLAYIDSETNLIDIKCIHANPERTIAKLQEENNIILPIISINQNSSSNADTRRRYAPNVVSESFWSEEKKRAFRVISLAPRAVDIEYGINIWAKYKANLDQIVEQIRLLFNPHLVLKNSYTNVAQAFIEQESDTSTFDIDDKEDRIVRRTFTIKLEGYIPNPRFLVTSTGEIEELNADTTIY